MTTRRLLGDEKVFDGEHFGKGPTGLVVFGCMFAGIGVVWYQGYVPKNKSSPNARS